MRPAGRLPFEKDIGDRRQVDQMDAAGVLVHVPEVRVAENVGLHLLAGTNDLEQGFGVFQAADGCQYAGIVVDQNQRGFARVGVERFGQPIQLFLAEHAGG